MAANWDRKREREKKKNRRFFALFFFFLCAGKEEIRFVSRFSAFVAPPVASTPTRSSLLGASSDWPPANYFISFGFASFFPLFCFFFFSFSFLYRSISFTLPCGKVCRVTWRRHSWIEHEQEQEHPSWDSALVWATGWQQTTLVLVFSLSLSLWMKLN